MTNKIRVVATALILLGAIGVAFNILFGNSTITFLTQERIEETNLIWYKFDIQSYLDNLTTTITDTTELKLNIPEIDYASLEWYDYIWVAVDYVILVINILLYPLKIGGYLVKFVLALLGFNLYNQASGMYWLGYLAQYLVGLTIPYI